MFLGDSMGAGMTRLIHHPGWWIGGLLLPLALITGWLVVWLALYPGLPFRHSPFSENAPRPPD